MLIDNQNQEGENFHEIFEISSFSSLTIDIILWFECVVNQQ